MCAPSRAYAVCLPCRAQWAPCTMGSHCASRLSGNAVQCKPPRTPKQALMSGAATTWARAGKVMIGGKLSNQKVGIVRRVNSSPKRMWLPAEALNLAGEAQKDWRRPESNRRPSACQADVITNYTTVPGYRVVIARHLDTPKVRNFLGSKFSCLNFSCRSGRPRPRAQRVPGPVGHQVGELQEGDVLAPGP